MAVEFLPKWNDGTWWDIPKSLFLCFLFVCLFDWLIVWLFSCLVSCCAVLWCVVLCRVALSLLVCLGLGPTRGYNATISACEKSGRWQQALRLFYNMQKDDIQRSIISFNATISACEKQGEWELALELFEFILSSKVAAWRCQPDGDFSFFWF